MRTSKKSVNSNRKSKSLTRYGGVRHLEANGIRQTRSHADQFAQTPDYIYDALDDEFHFDFDPCPVKPKFDGLEVDWGKRNFVNPPYDDLASWLNKGVEEMKKNSVSVFLIPFRPNTQYFSKYVLRQACEIRFFRDKITFKGYERPCCFGVCVVIFRPKSAQVSGNFSVIDIPPSVKERSVRKLQKTVEEKFDLQFDFVKRKANANVVNMSWGNVSFISVNSHVEKTLERCEEELSKGNVVVCVIPLRAAGSSFFAEKVMLGKARGVYALSRNLVCEGYSEPNPEGSLLLLYRQGPKIRAIGPKITISSIRKP